MDLVSLFCVTGLLQAIQDLVDVGASFVFSAVTEGGGAASAGRYLAAIRYSLLSVRRKPPWEN